MGNRSDNVAPTQMDGTPVGSDPYDVAIIGGGMAGLTLAWQLKQDRPALRLLVVEKQAHPVPEATHKVGESTVEIAAHYLRDVLGLADYLDTRQLHKFGLRMFFSADGNHDITRRVEYGQIEEAPLPSYQLDRGRLENDLGREIQRQGVRFLHTCTVQDIILQPQEDYHRLCITHDDNNFTLQARWIVDASGRRAMLKRQLGLAKPVGHQANAVWFRIAHPIDINTWSSDPAWQSRVCNGKRSLSTNHLMGAGYWVWLIPLASDSISIGIVTDAQMHAFEDMNRFDRALNWLHQHEPQCAAVVAHHRAQVQDFRVMKDYAYSCEQVYSSDRWCLTGEAAVAIDPLYSSGGDLIAIGNGLICDVITRAIDGEDIHERVAGHNQLFLILAEVWLVAYEQQYPLMGNARVMVAKVIWDTVIYWAFPGLLYFHNTFCTLSDHPQVFANVYRCWSLHTRIQAFFREWHAIHHTATAATFADPYSLLDMLRELHLGMAAGLSPSDLAIQFGKNTRLLEQMAGQLVNTVIELLSQYPANQPIQSQIQRWQADPLLTELIAIYQQEDLLNPIDKRWITLGSQNQAYEEVT